LVQVCRLFPGMSLVRFKLEKYLINGGKPVFGEIEISGAKNAAVAIIPAAILVEGVCRIENVPNIADVAKMLEILQAMGAEIKSVGKHTVEINCTHLRDMPAPYDMVNKMRASYYLIGSLLGRFGHALVSMPGGCAIGVRPIDQHVKGFEALGAEVEISHGMVDARATNGLKGSSVFLDVVSVGATVNIILAAVRAKGNTTIENAAREPHIVDLANFLNAMGADIRGAGTDVIKIRGGKRLHGGSYSIIPDQIEAGTYMALAAAAGGDLLVKNVIPKHMESISAKLLEMGAEVEEYDDSIRVRRLERLNKTNIKTLPYPGFPTDMQPQMAVLMSIAQGTSMINESVWENRYRYVDELKRMGAVIQVDGKIAVIEGVEHLTGAPVNACDLRAGAAMIIAGVCAVGTTEIEDIHYIERGYEEVIEKLQAIGVSIKKIYLPDKPEIEIA
jgi:UDP-N-acetylglucosamine 1-carboxyvinyltransferase